MNWHTPRTCPGKMNPIFRFKMRNFPLKTFVTPFEISLPSETEYLEKVQFPFGLGLISAKLDFDKFLRRTILKPGDEFFFAQMSSQDVASSSVPNVKQ
jgi:hypothetical protein